MRSLGLPSKTSSCEVNALKIKNTFEHDINSVLENFRNYYSTLSENHVKMLPKPTNKYSFNTVIKYYEHMILGAYFHKGSVSENPILAILKATQVSKAAGIDNLSGPISDLCNLSITSEKFPNIYKVAKHKPLYKKGSPRGKKVTELGLEYSKLGWCFRRCVIFTKSKHFLSDLIPSEVSQYNNRDSSNIATYHCKTDAFKDSFFPFTIKEWNVLDFNIWKYLQ